MSVRTRHTFESLTLPLQQDLYHFALVLTGNEPDAMDLTQETYLKAYRNFDSFEEGTNIRAWMIRIMKNAYIDTRRKRKYEPISLDASDDEPGETATLTDDELIEILPDELSRSFKELERGHRVLLLLCDVHSFSYKEIAEILDIPLGTCMSRIHRARQKLKGLVLKHRKAGRVQG